MRFFRMRDPAAFLLLVLPAVFISAGAAVAATCQLGQYELADATLYGVLAPGLKVYTLLDPAACAGCSSPPGMQLTATEMGLVFNKTGSLTLRVSIVGWLGSASCPRPYTTAVKCGPVDVVVQGDAGGNGVYALALPDDWCIQGRAFLCVEVVACPPGMFDVGMRVANASCVACVQRYEAGYLPSGNWDLCDATYGTGRDLAVWADAACCPLVPAVRPTWGRVKVLYR